MGNFRAARQKWNYLDESQNSTLWETHIHAHSGVTKVHFAWDGCNQKEDQSRKKNGMSHRVLLEYETEIVYLCGFLFPGEFEDAEYNCLKLSSLSWLLPLVLVSEIVLVGMGDQDIR